MSQPRKPNLFESMACGGAAAAFAVNFTHPIELVKTRMQASGGSIGGTISGVMKNEGVLSFWKGLPFAYGRELSYTSIKLGACKCNNCCDYHFCVIAIMQTVQLVHATYHLLLYRAAP